MTNTFNGNRNRNTTHTLEALPPLALEGHRLGGEIRFSSDGKRLIETQSNGAVSIWCADTGKKISECPPTREISRAGDATRSNLELIPRVISDDGRRIATLRCQSSVSRHIRPEQAWFSSDGLQVITSHYREPLQAWDSKSGDFLGAPLNSSSGTLVPRSDLDRLEVRYNYADKTHDICDPTTGLRIFSPPDHAGRVYGAWRSPDKLSFITVSWDSNLGLVWKAATREQVSVLAGHAGRIIAAQFSFDGQRIVTAASDGTAAVWNATSGERIALLVGHSAPLNAASFSGDGSRVLTAAGDKTATVWDAATGAMMAVLRGHTGGVRTASFSPDGRQIVTVSSDKTVRVWHATTGSEITTLGKRTCYAAGASWLVEGISARNQQIVIGTPKRNHKPDPTNAHISPDSRWLFYRDRLHDIEGHSRSTTLLPSAPDHGVACFSPRPGRIAMLGPSGIMVWRYGEPERLFVGQSRYRGGNTARAEALIPAPDNGFVFGDFSADSKFVVTSAIGDPMARVWDTSTGELAAELDAGDLTARAALSADGSRLITLDKRGQLSLWARDGGARLLRTGTNNVGATQRKPAAGSSWLGHAIRIAEFCPDGQRLVVGTANGTITLVDTLTGSVAHVIERPTSKIDELKFLPARHVLLVLQSRKLDVDTKGSSAAHNLLAVDSRTGAVLYEIEGRLLALSPDALRLVIARERETLVVSSLTGDLDWSVPAGTTAATFSGTRLIMAGTFGIQDFDAASGTPMGSFGTQLSTYFVRAMYSIGRQVFIKEQWPRWNRRNRATEHMIVVDAETGETIGRHDYLLCTEPSQAGSIALITPSGKLLLLSEGRATDIPFDQAATAASLSISPDGSMLIVGLKSGQARLFRFANNFEQVRLTARHDPAPTPSGKFVGFDPSGDFLLTYDASIDVWDIAAEKRAVSISFANAQVSSAAFSADGSQIIALCDDGSARIVGSRSGRTEVELRVQGGAIESVLPGPQIGTVAAICSDQTLRIFESRTGATLAIQHIGLVDALTCIAAGSDGRVTAVSGGVIHRWRVVRVGDRTKDGVHHFRLDGRPLKTKSDVADYLQVPVNVLDRALQGDRTEPRYKSYEIPKRTGGTRRIDAPIGVLRMLQQQLTPQLQSIYDAHPSAHGFVKGRSIVTNAAPHTRKRWVLNIDLADFFPSTGQPAIKSLFRKAPFSMGPEAAQTVAELCTYRYGLPQGASTSPVLSNLAAAALDARLERLARKFKLTYSRYADDITFSTNAMVFPPGIAAIAVTADGERTTDAGKELAKAVESCGFKIKPSKTRLQHTSQRQEVTGLGVNEKVNVARDRIRRLRAMLHAWRKFGLEAAAWEHFRKYGPGGEGAPQRHFVPTRYWRRDKVTNTWLKQNWYERHWPDRPEWHSGEPSWKKRKYRSFYLSGASARKVVPASFRRVVVGNLAYLHMVRGPDDRIVGKLCLALAQLDSRPPKFVAAILSRQALAAGEENTAGIADGNPPAGKVVAASRDSISGQPPTPIVRKAIEPEMVIIPAGSLATRAAGSVGSSSIEVIKSFSLAKFAVTFEEWDGCIPLDGEDIPSGDLELEPPSDRGWGRGARPVINVSWHDAQLYIAWLNRTLGLNGRPDAYRLPTELEWEYACRAGSSTLYHQGELITGSDANFNSRLSTGAPGVGEYRGQTMPVGTFAPNAWGLHEMHGNVWEWCDVDATGVSANSPLRTLRGGSWSNRASKLQAGSRWQSRADYRSANIGFRLARSIAEI